MEIDLNWSALLVQIPGGPHFTVLFIPWKGEFRFWAHEQKEIWLRLVRVILQRWWNASDKPGEWLSRTQPAAFSPQSFSVSSFYNNKITQTVIKGFREWCSPSITGFQALLSPQSFSIILLQGMEKTKGINCMFIRHQLQRFREHQQVMELLLPGLNQTYD